MWFCHLVLFAFAAHQASGQVYYGNATRTIVSTSKTTVKGIDTVPYDIYTETGTTFTYEDGVYESSGKTYTEKGDTVTSTGTTVTNVATTKTWAYTLTDVETQLLYPTLSPSTYDWESTSEWMSFIYNTATKVPSVVVTATPSVRGISYTWFQAFTPTILGTVYIVINNLNQTRTTTVTNSSAIASKTQYLRNGTLVLLTRTDVNEAGTVTKVLPSGVNGSITVAYPTEYFTVNEPIRWDIFTPYTGNLDGGRHTTCCQITTAASPVPQNHNPWPLSTGSTNPVDPKGRLYTMTSDVDVNYSGSRDISSLFSPATINSVINYCPYSTCPYTSMAADALDVDEAGELLTSTVHITVSTPSSAKAQAASAVSATPNSPQTPDVATPTTSSPAQVSNDASTAVQTSPQVSIVPGEPAPESQVAGSSKTPSTQVQATQQQSEGSSEPSSLQVQTPEQSSDTVFTTGPSPVSSSENNAGNDAGSVIGAIFGSHTTVTLGAGAQSTAATLSIADAQSMQTASSSPFTFVSIPASSAPPASSNTPTAITIGSVPLTLDSSSGYLIGSQTIVPGSSITLGRGTSTTVVALQTSASHTFLVVGSSTSLIEAPQGSSVESSAAAFTLGAAVLTPSNSIFIVRSQTLSPGSSITVGSGTSTTIVAFHTSASATVLVAGSSTSTLGIGSSTLSASKGPAVITIGSDVISPDPNSAYVIGSQTLSPGSAVTVSGMPYSLAPGGTELVIGTRTEILTTEAGIASYIWSAIGGVATTASSQPGNLGETTSRSTTLPGTGLSTASAPTGSQSPPVSGASNLWVGNLTAVLVFAMIALIVA
ncbi:hypothetical protein LTR15_012140 [Elasticomyces elasticus]|nr:hypothetical protein LTR15_012140 [Elasticomyces elasticus]